MDVKNALVTTTFPRSFQENRQLKPEQDARAESPQRPGLGSAPDFDSEAIARRGQEIQAERVERLNDTESVPLRTRQALDSYQGTQLASQQFETGELVGVDLFV